MAVDLAIINKFLLALSARDLALLLPHLEPVPLALRQQLEGLHQPVEFIYFVQSGLASMVAAPPMGRSAEIGIVGREGATGLSLAIGDTQSAFEVYMQMEGSGLRIGAAEFAHALEQSLTLRLLSMRYCRSLWIQCAYTALANSVTRLEPRLARWLLMLHDRIDGDRIDITHEFMAVMLAVRRPGVTVALHELEGKALIKSVRGTIFIRDREGLIEMADGAYGLPEIEYERLMGTDLMRESGAGLAPHQRAFGDTPEDQNLSPQA